MAKSKHKLVIFGGPPSVNLLPRRQRAELRHERTMPKLLLAIVASALVAGLIWAAGMVPTYLADQQLAKAEAESQLVFEQLEGLADVQRALGENSRLSAARQTLTEREVLFIDVRDEVIGALPEGTSLVRFNGVLGADASRANGGIELSNVCIGDAAILVLGIASDSASAASEVVSNLEGLTGVQCVVQTSFGSGEVTVQLGLSSEATSGRFKEAQ